MDLAASGLIKLEETQSNKAPLDQIVEVQLSPGLSGMDPSIITFYQTAMIQAMNDLDERWNSMKEEEIQVYKTKLEQMIADDMLDEPSTTTPYDIFIFENI